MPTEQDVTNRKSVIQAIVNVFETGKPDGDYSAVVIHDDGAGISYGRSQATDGGDNLDLIVFRYLDLGGRFADDLRPFLANLAKDLTTKVDPKAPPAWAKKLMATLAKAGREDPLMRLAQDQIFDEQYWNPAVQHVHAMRLVLPLSAAVVYDTCIHSGPAGVANIRKRFPERPPSTGGEEKAWTRAYVKARRKWLAAFPNPVVQKTVYRMNEIQTLIDAGNWELVPPFKVLKRTIA